MEKIKWILSDLGGVVTQLAFTNPDGYRYKTRYFRKEDLEGFFLTKDYAHYMLGLISHEQCVGKYLARKKLDLSVAEFDELYKNNLIPNEEVIELYKKMAEKYKIALVTNEGKLLMKYRVEGAGIMPYLSKIIPSYLVREVKPSPDFYKKTLSILDTKPDECIFIDDLPANISGAQDFGIKSILFTTAIKLEADLVQLQLI